MYRALMANIERLRRDETGAVLPIFTVFMVSLLLVTAIGVDYGRALVVKQKLANAADAAALAVGADPTLTQDEADAKALAFIKAHFPDADFGDLLDYKVVMDASKVDVNVSARLQTTFLKVARVDTIDVGVHSEVLRQQRDIEVVMVLDNTTSMSQSACRRCETKIEQLKTAANKLVTILFGDSATSEHVKIGLVPFSGTVNVGTDKIGSGWLDENGDSHLQTEDLNLTSNMSLLDLFDRISNVSWGGCVRARIQDDLPGTDLDLTDAAPVAGTPDTLWVPYFAPDEPDNSGGGGPFGGSVTYLNNYLGDGSVSCPGCNAEQKRRAAQRSIGKYNGANVSSQNLNASIPKGPNFNCVPQPIQPLTNQKSLITTALTGMQANGYTAIPFGLSWGWKVISPSTPYTEGAAYSEQRVAKAIILLTDGRNQIEGSNGHNNSPYSAYGYAASGHMGPTNGSGTRSALDDKVETLCTNIKANKDDIAEDQDIYIYAITFDVDDEDTRTLMSSCATPPADCPGEQCYFDSPTGADLETAFESIALGLNKLRLAK